MKIKALLLVLFFLVNCNNNITDNNDNRSELYGVWVSDTITTDDNYMAALSRKVIYKEITTVRLTNTIAELSSKEISYYSSTIKDSVWGLSIYGPYTRNAESWTISNDSIKLINVVCDWDGTKNNEFKFKYKYVDDNEMWIWNTAVDCDLPNCMLWTWFKCKRIN
jgi:hypothetical protein